MVRSPAQYRSSSFRHNGQGKTDALICPHPLYTALGKSGKSRLTAYNNSFQAHLDQGVLDDIRAAWQTNAPLGNAYFRKKIEVTLKCRGGQAGRGRPSKPRPEDERSF